MDLFDIVAARVGGGGSGGGAPQVQSDWEQNDSSKKDYIKNRTHWKEEFERDYTVLPNVEPDPIMGFIEYGKKIGLEIGKEYTLEAHLLDGTIETIQAIATEFPVDEIGIAGIPCFMLDFGTVVDGVVFDTISGNITTGDNCYYVYDDYARELLEKVIIKNLPNIETVVHQIPEEYLPKIEMPMVNQDYDSNSQNAQSGIAVEQAINEYDKSLMIGAEKLVDKSVTTEKLADKSVITAKLADKSVGYAQLADNSVGASKLANNSVTNDKVSSKISYSKLAPGTTLKTQYVTEEVAYISLLVDSDWEELLVTGTIKPSFSGEQHFCIDFSSSPGGNRLVQVPIDTTNIEGFEVDCLIRRMSAATLGTLDIHLHKAGGSFYAPETYVEKTIPLSYIPISGGSICFYLKGGDTESFLYGTSINVYNEKPKRMN